MIGSDYRIYNWQQANAPFFNAVEVERNVMFLILTLIIIVAAFNIISSLTMLVKDKRRDIAILRTMGTSRGSVMRVFFIAGASFAYFVAMPWALKFLLGFEGEVGGADGDVTHHPFNGQIEALAAGILDGTPILPDIDDAMKTHEGIFAADKSAAAGRPGKLPLER